METEFPCTGCATPRPGAPGLDPRRGAHPSGAGELIRPSADRVYPDIAADINGVQDYDYDPTTRTGLFQVTNTPFLLAMGSSIDDEYNVQPNSEGVRRQTVQLKLDQHGRLIDDPENSYRLYGTVVVGGETFDGLLLEGTPRSFGAKAARAAGIDEVSVYDLDMKITGGVLAERFGPDAYMRISPEVANTFDGSFSKSFAGVKAQSNTRAYQRRPRRCPSRRRWSSCWPAGRGTSTDDDGGSAAKTSSARSESPPAGADLVSRPGRWPRACRAPRSRSGGPARGSGRATRRSP